MITGLSVALLLIDAAMIVLAGWYLWRRRLMDDRLLLLGGLLELGLVLQLVLGIVRVGQSHGRVSAPIFVAYLVAVLVVPPGALFLALKERSRWGMAIAVFGGLIVAVLIARLQQIWTVGA